MVASRDQLKIFQGDKNPPPPPKKNLHMFNNLKRLLDLKIEDAGFLECEVMEKIRENGTVIRNDLVAKLPVPIKIRGGFISMLRN